MKKHSFFKSFLLLLMTTAMLFTSCVIAFAEPFEVTAPQGVSEDETFYSVVFENGVLCIRVNPEKIYEIIKDGNISREELLKFVPDDVLSTLSKGTSLTLDDITGLVSQYITLDDLKELINLVPADILRNYFTLDMLDGILTLNEILSVIPVDEILGAVDPAAVNALITDDVFPLLLNNAVKSNVVTEEFVNNLIENSTLVDDVKNDPVIRPRLMALLTDDFIDSLVNDPITGPQFETLAEDPEVISNILADAAAISTIIAYVTSSANEVKMKAFINDSAVSSKLFGITEISDGVVNESVIIELYNGGELTKEKIRRIFTDAQINSLITSDTIKAQLSDDAFISGVFGDTDLINKIFTETLLTSLANNHYFDSFVTPEDLYNDGLITDEEIYDNFPLGTQPTEITLNDVLDKNLVTIDEIRSNYISDSDMKTLIQTNAAFRDEVAASVTANTTLTIDDYWDYINISLLIPQIKNLIDSDTYSRFTAEVSTTAVFNAVGMTTIRTVLTNNASSIITAVGMNKVFSYFSKSAIVTELGGYTALYNRGYVSEDKAVEAAGGYTALIKKFDINDVINAVGTSKLLEYVAIQDVVDSVGGYPALFGMYSNDELKAIFDAIGTENIRTFITDSGIINSIDIRGIASDLIALLRTKAPQLKALVKQVLEKCLSILLTEVDGIYINNERVFKNGQFDLNKILTTTLRAIPDIEDILNLTTDDIFASYKITVDFGGDEYDYEIKFGFLGDPSRLLNKLADYVDYFKLEVSDTLDINLDLTLPGAVSSLYERVLESTRVPSALKEKLLLLPMMTVNEAKAFVRSLTDDEIQAIIDLVKEKSAEIKQAAVDKVRAYLPDNGNLSAETYDINPMNIGTVNVDPSDLISKAEAEADKVINYFVTRENFEKLRSYTLAVLDKISDSLSDRTIADFYNGNGNFTAQGGGSVDIYEALNHFVTVPEDIRLLFEDMTISVSVDVDLTAHDFYCVNIIGTDGREFTTFLPNGVDLTVLNNVDKLSSYSSSGWVDENASYASSMPGSDVTLYSNDLYYVQFVIGDEIIDTVFYNVGDQSITAPEIPENKIPYGKTGSWSAYTLGSAKQITSTLELESIQYKAEFYVEGVLYDTVYFTVDDTELSVIPECPAKEGYSGVWNNYTLAGADIRIDAIYSANQYKVTFRDYNGALIDEVTYTFGDTEIIAPDLPEGCHWDTAYDLTVASDQVITAVRNKYYVTFLYENGDVYRVVEYEYGATEIEEPPVPDKAGHSVKRWNTYTLDNTNFSVSPYYEIDRFSVRFYDENDNLIKEIFYDYGATELDINSVPAVPVKKGYTGIWTSYTPNNSNRIVKPIYTANTYTITFVDYNGTALGAPIEYTYGTTFAQLTGVPTVPVRTGYTDGVWSGYNLLEDRNQIARASYTPIQYTATFKAGGIVVGTVNFTIETETLTAPDVPEKAGYTGIWSDYTLGIQNIEINAVYTPIIYTATFRADGKVIGTVQFTIEDASLNEPAVPSKEGYNGVWEKYTIGAGDITVNAVYTPIGSHAPGTSVIVPGKNNAGIWIIVIVVFVIAIGVVVFLLVRKNKNDDGTDGTPTTLTPEDGSDDGDAEPEPEAEVKPETEDATVNKTSNNDNDVVEIPVEHPVEEIVENRIDAVKADEMMTDEEALAFVEVSPITAPVGLKAVINIGDINNNFNVGDIVNADTLKAKKLVPAKTERVKVLAGGFINKAVTVEADSFSVQAIKMIKLTGGTVIQKK